MRGAKIVYIILGAIILLPWFVYNIKVYLNNKANKKKFSAGRIIVLILVSVLLCTGIFAHYRFTIGYQIPLVAERAGNVFSKRMEAKLDASAYQEEMQRQKLSGEAGVQTVSDEELQKAGLFNKQTGILLSERIYPMEDGSMAVYLMYDDGQEPLYTFLQLKQTDYSWKVVQHNILSQVEFDEFNEELKIKFYNVD